MEQVKAYGDVNRDTGGRVVSVAFYALVRLEEFDTSLARKFDARWVKIQQLPKLVFDHNRMVEDALTLLRYKTSMQPIIFNFFDKKFTLPALQDCTKLSIRHLSIKEISKKIASMQILDKLNIKDKTSSKRGAHYYAFKRKKIPTIYPRRETIFTLMIKDS